MSINGFANHPFSRRQKCIYSGHLVSKTFAKKYEISHNLLHFANFLKKISHFFAKMNLAKGSEKIVKFVRKKYATIMRIIATFPANF